MSGVVLLPSGKDITQVCGDGILIGRGKGAVGATAEGQDICECGGKASCFSPHPPPHSLSPPFSSSSSLFSSPLQVGSQATEAWQDITTVVSHFRAFGPKEPVRKATS